MYPSLSCRARLGDSEAAGISTRLVASITVEAAWELGLSEGSEVVAIIKASDVILAVPD